MADVMINEFRNDVKKDDDGTNFDILVAVFVICVIACVVGIAWKRK